MRRAITNSSVFSTMLLTGCVNALRPYNTPSQQKLDLQTATPTNCVIRVADEQTFPVAADGRVTFDVPRLPRGCDTYLFGVVKIADGSPENIQAIHVSKNGKIVRKLSLSQLGRLPVDADGYHILIVR
jgi:hypothetical protein